MNLSDFDYNLPKEFIAQQPLEERDQSKLMVLNRSNQTIGHHHFFELPELLDKNSVLVFNESRVIPARLKFRMGNGGAEILLVKPIRKDVWECMVKPGPKFQSKTDGQIDPECGFHVKDITSDGLRIIHFKCDDFNKFLKRHGQTPTPPYIKDYTGDSERYQTIYAKSEGSVAAPTAGFHFTDKVFSGLKAKGIQTEFVALHVGLGTFQPVKIDDVTKHQMHSEWFSLPKNVAGKLNKAKKDDVLIPEDVVFFIANSNNDVKNLLNNVVKLETYASLDSASINLSLAKTLMRGREKGKIDLEDIKTTTAAYFNILLSDLVSNKKKRIYSYPRQLAMYLARKHTLLSLNEIGSHFGHKDHSTIIYAIKRIEKNRERNKTIIDDVKKIENLLA